MTRIWAHRGASAHGLENTLAALELAREHGADGVEIDVRLTLDRHVVVFHDPDLRRLAMRPERIDALTADQIREVLLGEDGRISTLAEALEAAAPLPVNVELKLDRIRGTGLEAAVVDAIRRSGADGRVLLSSFHPVALWRLRRLAPHLPRAVLFSAREGTRWAVRPVGARAVHPHHDLVTAARLARWRARGLEVNTWTVDDPDEIRRLAGLGVDGIITNDPRRAREALSRSPAP